MNVKLNHPRMPLPRLFSKGECTIKDELSIRSLNGILGGLPAPIKSAIKGRIRPRDKHSFLCQLKPNAEILDVGCGNNSPFLTKSILPSCIYTGIDIGDYNQTEPNLSDKYIITTAENFAEEIGKFQECFDAVISAHNIEHCNDREETLEAMLGAVKCGGQLFISFPSANSVNLPKRGGTLNYYDDPTHKYLPPNFEAMLGTMKANGFEIEFAVQQHHPFLDYVRGLINESKSIKQDMVMPGTWAYHGFESIIWARKP